jgi:hypothetical protein
LKRQKVFVSAVGWNESSGHVSIFSEGTEGTKRTKGTTFFLEVSFWSLSSFTSFVPEPIGPFFSSLDRACTITPRAILAQVSYFALWGHRSPAAPQPPA